jgi:hypothetical protein
MKFSRFDVATVDDCLDTFLRQSFLHAPPCHVGWEPDRPNFAPGRPESHWRDKNASKEDFRPYHHHTEVVCICPSKKSARTLTTIGATNVYDRLKTMCCADSLRYHGADVASRRATPLRSILPLWVRKRLDARSHRPLITPTSFQVRVLVMIYPQLAVL